VGIAAKEHQLLKSGIRYAKALWHEDFAGNGNTFNDIWVSKLELVS
jgi:hypothetical protein